MSEKKERRNKRNQEEDVKEGLPIEQKEEIQTPMHLWSEAFFYQQLLDATYLLGTLVVFTLIR